MVKMSRMDGWVYEIGNIEGGEVVCAIIGYEGNKKDIVIPDKIGKFKVIEIRIGAFRGRSDLKSITIPKGVTSIGGYAFYGCRGLKSITIPEGVTSIGYNAFGCCSGLKSIVVNKNNKYYDSRSNCNAIISTSGNELIAGCKNTKVPKGVTSIGGDAFYYCSGLKSITIPKGVTRIGSGGFYCCITPVFVGGICSKTVSTAEGNRSLILPC